MPGPKTKEEYRKDLMDNIALIKKFDPSFEMTQEQIDYMLSDERYNLHCRHYGKKASDGQQKRTDIVNKYSPRYPAALWRHTEWFIHDENTPEGQKYNEELLENIGRDDEIGLEVQNQYLFKAYNAVFDVDMSKFSDNVSLTEFMDYAEKNSNYGKSIMETQHLLAEFKNLKPKEASGEKIRAVYNFGSSAGAVLGNAVELVGNEAFLTLPVEFLNSEQREKLGTAVTKDPEKLLKYGNFVSVMESWSDNKKYISKGYKELKKFVEEGEKIGPDDFEPKMSEDAIVGGGYLKRRETCLQVIDKNASYVIFSQDKNYQKMVEEGNTLKSMIQELGDKLPDEKKQKELSDQAKKYTKTIYDFTKIDGVLNSDDPAISQIGKDLKNSMPFIDGYSKPDILKANIHYYGVDSGYVKEVEHLIKQLKKTEGNLTANSPAYDEFSKLLKGMPEKLNQLKADKNITFAKIQEVFQPVVTAAGEYFESHKDVKLNSRQFNRMKIMNRLKDLAKEASGRSAAPGKDIDYRLAEKIYTAKAIKIKGKNLLMDDAVREEGIRNILGSNEFKRDFASKPLEAKQKLLRVPGEKVLDGMMKQYSKSKAVDAPENVNSKEEMAMKIG